MKKIEQTRHLISFLMLVVVCMIGGTSHAQNEDAKKMDEQLQMKVQELYQQFESQNRDREFQKAAETLSKALQLKDVPTFHYLRGRVQFCLGQFEASVKSFDAYVKAAPNAESRQWERGISMYYARQYKRGAQQFELYQTFHDQDVENSVWRFLCMVPETGVKKARAVMLPIENDRRIPMMKVFEMYRGTATPQDVLNAARRGDPDASTLKGRLFYAHLYLGLYYEVLEKDALARKYIKLAADKSLTGHPGINTYMWDVARVHWERLQVMPKRK